MRKRVLAAALALAVTTPGQAQDADTAAKVTALARLQSATSPALSPDGKRLAYLSNASGSPQVWVRDLITGTAKQVTALSDPVDYVTWSPVADLIAYTVPPGGGLNSQIWVSAPDGDNPRRLTAGGKETNALSGWTRDGRYLRAATNKDNPGAQDPVLIDVATGATVTLVANRGLNDFADLRGDRVVFARLIGRGDANLYLFNRRTGAETLLTPHTGKAESYGGFLTADGRGVIVSSNVGRDREAFGLIPLDAAGQPGPIRYFATRDDAVSDGMALSLDGRTLALAWNVAGRFALDWYDVPSGTLRPGPRLPFDVGLVGPLSNDGRTLTLYGAGADRTGDLYLLDRDSGRVTRVTESRHDGVDLTGLVRPQLVTYAANDGTPLSGWLYRPNGASGPLPTVFSYHGGPEGQAFPSLFPDAQALVATGIQVFAPNVRGSSGFGKAFMAMDDGAKRVNSVADIKASTDALVSRNLADPKRLGIMGGSYGGYMVMAGVTEFPKMFAAGVDLFGIVNFESFFRETEPWMAAISTTEYGDPKTQAAMLEALSPIHKLDRITTPLFVLHGANDTNVPVVEAEQIVASLKARGVPVKYTLFPDEGHGWRQTANRVRSTTEITAFFVERLRP